MHGFVGRRQELATLSKLLDRVAAGGRAGRPGRAVLMRGRRRVGKSRLVEEFVDTNDVPHMFFTAAASATTLLDLQRFVQAGLTSTLPGASIFESQAPGTWDAALRLLVQALPTDRPSVVVVDEMPYLIANDPSFDGALQSIFDRELSRLPVLLIGIGSDLAMMESLDQYGRPFHQRATEMVISALSPKDVGEMLALAPADAIDAYLVSGGLPLILDEWPQGSTLPSYVAEAVSDPTSALIVSGERAITAEFPAESQARDVLGAIGSGERTFTSIARAAGGLPQASLVRALDLLTKKRIVQAIKPMSTRPSNETRYYVADSHLRWWLAFIGPNLPEIERGRGDLVMARFSAFWSSWRGRAVEPVIRDALNRLTDRLPAGTATVGGYWTRNNDPEIDLVGGDREPVAKAISFVGSVKWQETRPFDAHDLARMIHHRGLLPGATESTPLVAVSRSGGDIGDEILQFGPEDLVAAF